MTAEEKIAELEATNARLRESADAVEHQWKLWCVEAKRVEAENARLRTKNARLVGEVAALKDDRQNAEDAERMERTQRIAAEQENARLRNELDGMTRSRDKWQRIAEVEHVEGFQNLKAEVARLREALDDVLRVLRAEPEIAEALGGEVVAKVRAALEPGAEKEWKEPGCSCHQEPGDSECFVHGADECGCGVNWSPTDTRWRWTGTHWEHGHHQGTP